MSALSAQTETHHWSLVLVGIWNIFVLYAPVGALLLYCDVVGGNLDGVLVVSNNSGNSAGLELGRHL